MTPLGKNRSFDWRRCARQDRHLRGPKHYESLHSRARNGANHLNRHGKKKSTWQKQHAAKVAILWFQNTISGEEEGLGAISGWPIKWCLTCTRLGPPWPIYIFGYCSRLVQTAEPEPKAAADSAASSPPPRLQVCALRPNHFPSSPRPRP